MRRYAHIPSIAPKKMPNFVHSLSLKSLSFFGPFADERVQRTAFVVSQKRYLRPDFLQRIKVVAYSPSVLPPFWISCSALVFNFLYRCRRTCCSRAHTFYPIVRITNAQMIIVSIEVKCLASGAIKTRAGV